MAEQAGQEQDGQDRKDGQDGHDGHPLRQFGRQSSFQKHCSHESSGSQLMSPRESGGAEVGP